MKKRLWVPMLIIAVTYAALRWDYHVSKYMFEKICSDPDRVGLFIYERIELKDEYLMSILSEEEIRKKNINQWLILTDDLMIDKDFFDEKYTIKAYEWIKVSDVGPINLVQSSVIQNSDNKVLGKAVSVSNGLGWLNKVGSWGGVWKSMPIWKG